MDTPPSCYEIEARVRNGNADFESAIYTPGTPSPYDPGSKKWQLNPQGSPVWNSHGNVYGDVHSFLFTYTASTGTTIWSIDFNRDGDFSDHKESVTNVAQTLIGKGFQYINILGQGNDYGKTASLLSFKINGVEFGPLSSSTNTPFSVLYEDSTGLFKDIIITGQFSFSGQGSPERPRIWVRLAESNVEPSCQLTSPETGSIYSQGTSFTLSAVAVDPTGKIKKVEFYDGKDKIGEDLSYPYIFEYTNAPSGTRSLRAKAIDHQEAMMVSNIATITVIGPPTIRIVSPTDASVLFDPDTIVIVAEINNDSSYVVEFYKRDTLIGTDDTRPYTNHTLQNAPMGPYVIHVKSKTAHGMVFESPDTQFTVRCIREDINNDGIVNTFDFLLFLAAFGFNCNHGCLADFNDDTEVSTLDFLRLLTKLGYSCL